MSKPNPELILASTSPYRSELLLKTGIPFTTQAPAVDEEILKQQAHGLSPSKLAIFLAQQKALSVSQQHPEAWIIGSDQLVHFDNEIIGKPLTSEKCLALLGRLSGKRHEILTAVCLVRGGKHILHLDTTLMSMKSLTQQELMHYIEVDKPLDCAGGYKIEQSGIVLFDSIHCQDLTAVQGFPMIWVTQQLKEIGYEFFCR